MASENPPFAIQADSHSSELFRRAICSLTGGVTNGTPGGVVAPADLAVTAGSGNSVNVAAGEVWVPGSSASHMGAYYGYNDAVVNIGTTPNASNPMYYIITATVNDQAYTGNDSSVTNNTWNVLATAGTPAPSPSVPATPANSLLLATVLVPASASSSSSYTIVDKRVFVGMPNANRNNPAGIIVQTAASAVGVGYTQVTFGAATPVLKGGMTWTPSAFTVPVAGLYSVAGNILSAGNGTDGPIGLTVYRNAAATAVITDLAVPAISASPGAGMAGLIACNAGDTLAMYAYFPAAANTVPAYVQLSAALVSQ